jgi:hypothetical protein
LGNVIDVADVTVIGTVLGTGGGERIKLVGTRENKMDD